MATESANTPGATGSTASTASTDATTGATNAPPNAAPRQSLAQFIRGNRLDALTNILRGVAVACLPLTLVYGPDMYYMMLRAMLAVFLLRLYQRHGVSSRLRVHGSIHLDASSVLKLP
jgi:hypothetical protein